MPTSPPDVTLPLNHTHSPSLIADITSHAAYDIISDLDHAHCPPGCIMSIPVPTTSPQATPILTPGSDVT